MRLFNTIAFMGMAFSYIGLSFMTSSEQRHLALGLFCLASAFLGFNVGSFFKSTPVVAQIYSGFLMGIVQFTTNVVILIIPFIVGPMTQNGTLGEWQVVMLMTAAILTLSNIIFCMFGSGDPAVWAVEPQKISQELRAQNIAKKEQLILAYTKV